MSEKDREVRQEETEEKRVPEGKCYLCSNRCPLSDPKCPKGKPFEDD